MFRSIVVAITISMILLHTQSNIVNSTPVFMQWSYHLNGKMKIVY